ncbi:hypothetical protein FTX61_03470 [Nitriliruptoraceae bacterium ZYF776]|nr:hypothetical protein [Profundirhabdus halotolerans]
MNDDIPPVTVDRSANWVAGLVIARARAGWPLPSDVLDVLTVSSGNLEVLRLARRRIDAVVWLEDDIRLRARTLLRRAVRSVERGERRGPHVTDDGGSADGVIDLRGVDEVASG